MSDDNSKNEHGVGRWLRWVQIPNLWRLVLKWRSLHTKVVWHGIKAEVICGMSISTTPMVIGWHHSKLKEGQLCVSIVQWRWIGVFCLFLLCGLVLFVVVYVRMLVLWICGVQCWCWTNILHSLTRMGVMQLLPRVHYKDFLQDMNMLMKDSKGRAKYHVYVHVKLFCDHLWCGGKIFNLLHPMFP